MKPAPGSCLLGTDAEEIFHLIVEEALAGTIGLDPFAVEDKLGDGALAYVAKHLIGRAGCGLDVDLFVWDGMLGEEALGLSAVAAPVCRVENKLHTSILQAIAPRLKNREACPIHYPYSCMDYFAIFSLPQHLVIDTAALEKSFYALSRRLHPDRFAARPLAEQEAALTESSRLNDAYRTLRDPIARTEYLLKLEGIELEEQSRAATDAAKAAGTAKKQVVPEDLLEEAFELNMQLEEMKMGDDNPQLRQDLLMAKRMFESKLAEADADLVKLHGQWDAAFDAKDVAARNGARDAMVALLNRRSYLRNLVRDVNGVLEA